MDNRIKELRELKGWSQEKLARESDLSLRALQAIEKGRAVPGMDRAQAIAAALGCSVSELFPEPELVIAEEASA